MQHATALAFSQLSQSVYADQLGKKNRKKRGKKEKEKNHGKERWQFKKHSKAMAAAVTIVLSRYIRDSG